MIVFPMAGLSSRFTNAGYTKPKFMLELQGQTLFTHAVSSFSHYFASEPFLVVARSIPGVQRFIEAEMGALGIPNWRLVLLPEPTRGQADTVRLGLEQADIDAGEPLTVFNIDTIRPNFRYPIEGWMADADGYLEVMQSDDPGYSYVLPAAAEEDCRVARTAEKIVISNLASTGLYWFRRASLFIDALHDSKSALVNGEMYIAPLYNSLTKRGMDIRYKIVREEDVIFCGTPQQYEELTRLTT